MTPGQASAAQTMTNTPRRRRSAVAGWLVALLLCLASTAWGAAMVTNGGFDGSTGWSYSGTPAPTYTTAQNSGLIVPGAGSTVENANGRNKTSTGVAAQTVSIGAGSTVDAVSLRARELWTGASGATRTVTIDLRYQDATTVRIFSGMVGANSTWGNITNTSGAVFPMTLTKNVNQITVTLTTTTGNNASATSNLYVDDIAITYTAAQIDSLTVTANTSVATTAAPGATNIQMQYLQLNSDTTGDDNCVITSATIDDVNIAATGTIANLKVHLDTDTNYVNGVLGTATVANWNGQSTLVSLAVADLTVAERTVYAGTPKYLWITYDIDAGALDGTTVLARVTAIGVLAPDNAPLGGPWDSNSVLITVGLGCGGCHPNPMVDGVARDPATGGVVGDHTKHASAQGYECTLCHLATPNTPRHRDTFIAIVDPIQGVANARYTTTGKTGVVTGAGFVKFDQTTTPVRGNCQNTYCHGGINTVGNYGGPTGSGPQWGGTNADTCTFCHNANKTNAGGLANAYPSGTSPFRSNNGAGAHAVHMGGSSGLIDGGVTCDDCHVVPGTITAAGHIDDATIAPPADLTFGANAALNGTTTNYAMATLTCTVYCHGANMPNGSTGGTNRTPAWTANWTNYSAGCSDSCHGLPPSSAAHSGQTYPATCKNCHGNTVTTTVSPPTINPVYHLNGVVDATGCSGCHGGGTTGSVAKNYWPDGSTAHAANQAGRHVKHMTAISARLYGLTLASLLNDAASDTKQKAICDYCHQGSTSDGDHMSATDAEVFPSATYAKMLNGTADGGTVASYTPANDTCSNVDCHNNKLTAAGTFDWYSAGTSTCMMCHTAGGASNDPISGLHSAVPSVSGQTHDDSFGTGGTCASCHTMTTAMINSTTGSHINAVFDGNGFSAANRTAMGLATFYTNGGADNTGTCATTSCHLSFSDAWAHKWESTANYYTTAATACEGCHGDASSGWNAGVDHRSRGPHTAGATYGCGECHVIENVNYTFTWTTNDWAPKTGETTSKHGNQTIEVNSKGNYTPTTFNTCDQCHADDHGDGIHNFVDTAWTIDSAIVGPDFSGGTCSSCHGYPPTPGDAYAYKAVEGKGAHVKHVNHLLTRYGQTLTPATDTYGNAAVTAVCGRCHDMNLVTHTTGGGSDRLINFNGATTYRFGAAGPTYNGTVGVSSTSDVKSCSSVSCHFKTTPAWE